MMKSSKMDVETFLKYLKILSLHLLVFIPSVVSESSSYKKCCNNGEILSFKDGLYRCQSAPDYAPEFEERLVTKKPDELIVSEGLFPVCKTAGNLRTVLLSEVNPHDDQLLRDDNFCTDIFFDFHLFENIGNGKTADDLAPTVLSCSSSSKSNFNSNSISNKQNRGVPTVFKVRRCCAKGEIYEINKRACLPVDDNLHDVSTASLVRNIAHSDFIHAVRGPPKCQHAIVDYEVNVTDVSHVADRLQVTVSDGYDVVNLLSTEEGACVDVGSSPGLMIVRACRGVEYCRDNSCTRKCCPEDQAFVNNTCRKLPSHLTIAKWHDEIWQLPKLLENTTYEVMNTTDYGILIGKPCRNGMYPVYRHEGWHIVPEGKLHVDNYETYEHHKYCTEMFYNYSNNRVSIPNDFYPFICFGDDNDTDEDKTVIKTRFTVNASLLSISCAFLLVTLFVYICLPSLQNLHGKTLMCHVASLFVAFGCLVIVAISTPKFEAENVDEPTLLDSNLLCKTLGYVMLFSFLSAFFWLNVVCFDIWWKFGSLRNSGRTTAKRRDDLKRFLTYCFYAWGLAMIFAIIAVLADLGEFLPKYLKPGIGVDRCWFASDRGDYGEILFFTGPVSIQLVVNLIFFIMTARRCSMVKAEIQRHVMIDRTDSRSRTFEADKTKFILNVKLFVVMGISWVLEVISYFLNNYANDLKWKSEFFYISDVVNCLQGLLIFVLFVLKKKVFNALKRKFSKGSGKRRVNSTGGILDPYRVRKSPSNSTILSTFVVSSSP